MDGDRETQQQIWHRMEHADDQMMRTEIGQLIYGLQEMQITYAGLTRSTKMLDNNVTGIVSRVTELEAKAASLPEHIKEYVTTTIKDSDSSNSGFKKEILEYKSINAIEVLQNSTAYRIWNKKFTNAFNQA